MKKLFVVLGICLCLCFGCAEDNRSPILPKAENVDSICIDFTNSIQKIYDDSESIQKILSEIATGKRTEKQSIQDYPSAEEYGTINIENNGGMTTMFYYEENTLAHAELQAIRKASKKMDDWRLEDCTMYVTLEPCQMCSGAIVQARIKRVVVGCMNPKAGCAGSILNLLDMKEFNHQVELTTGVLEEQCSGMMKQFFKELRQKQKDKKKKSE